MTYRVIQANTPIQRSEFPEGAIFFFDFDGVLATQCEEKLFRLPEGEGERDQLIRIAEKMGLEHRLYGDTPYLRHLVYQHTMDGNLVDEHHEMLAFVSELNRTLEPYFVITARSGFGAVRRLITFLEYHWIDAAEVFCLGRSSKAALLAALRADWPDRPFVFFEDSRKHLDACKALNDPNLHIVEVQWPSCTENASRLLDRMYAHHA